jgi:hypothetical protein
MASSDNLLLIGFSTGLMYLIDMRTGWIQESCKNLDNEILQVFDLKELTFISRILTVNRIIIKKMKFLSNEKFSCTYNDGSISLSTIKDKIQLQNMIKGRILTSFSIVQ